MKTLLCAVNAKYIHTGLAVRSLYHYVSSPDVSFAEFTINERAADVLTAIYRCHAQTVLFSCYIWNIEFVLKVSSMLKKVAPDTSIIFGGPEVSFNSIDYMEKYQFIDGIICGEGEETFREFLEKGFEINGMTFRKKGKIQKMPEREPICDITQIPFPYDENDIISNHGKLIYYESSRGCPFNCSYCLSSTTHSLRFRDIDTVKQELMFFIKHKVPIVKFVDRTFNADRKRTCELLEFLIDNSKETTFHFEIAADLINDEILSVLKKAPDGLFQMEIGVQSTNNKTISAVDRKTDFEKIKQAVNSIRSIGGIHIHLDLIAGLPYEDLKSFRNSFDEVFALKPDVLQLGFLKLLRGTKIRSEENLFGYKYTDNPPYEILSNNFLSFDDILLLKGIEDVFDRYYNSGVFTYAINYLLSKEQSPFDFFKRLWQFYFENGYNAAGQSRNTLYHILCEFEGGADEKFRDYLKLDYLINNKGASSPSWSLLPYDRRLLKLRFDILTDDFIRKFLPEYIYIPPKEIVKSLHFEPFVYDVYGNGGKRENIIIFDNKYNRRIRIWKDFKQS